MAYELFVPSEVRHTEAVVFIVQPWQMADKGTPAHSEHIKCYKSKDLEHHQSQLSPSFLKRNKPRLTLPGQKDNLFFHFQLFFFSKQSCPLQRLGMRLAAEKPPRSRMWP